MVKFEVILKFYYTELYEDECNCKFGSRKPYREIKFDLSKYLKSYEPSYFVKNFQYTLYFKSLLKTAKWMDENKLYFIVQSNDKEVTEEKILETFIKYPKCEDEDTPWVIKSYNTEDVWGFLEFYQKKDMINIKKIESEEESEEESEQEF